MPILELICVFLVLPLLMLALGWMIDAARMRNALQVIRPGNRPRNSRPGAQRTRRSAATCVVGRRTS